MWMDVKDAAKHCRRSVSSFDKMRMTGDGPRYSKQGRAVRYHVDDLDCWMRSAMVRSTAEAA